MNRDELLELIDRAAREEWTELDLRNQGLTELPPEIGRLTHLTIFNLMSNKLRALPSEIGRLTHLTRLDLWDNKLWDLPLEIGQLIDLTYLSLSYNRLMTLRPEIGQLTNLTELDLHDNELMTLPPEISQLKNLTSLDLSENHLTALPPEIDQLTHLTKLDLSGNHLTALPSEIGQLTHLTKLYLWDNKLMALPLEIGQLINLTNLNLDNNRLTALPPEIGQLTQLTSLDLRDNPDLPLPPEILKKTREPQAIIQAWLDYLAGQTRPLHETKLVLVGEGSVGKTSLVNRLLHDTFDPHSEKTEGIAIHRWHPDPPQSPRLRGEEKGSGGIQVNIWDFGGQEIMHATHQFFLTKRTLYVLVLDNRYSEAENRLDYWLTLIRSFGGDSPILVVGNKSDQHPLDLDRRGLKAEHRTVQAILDTSCKTGAGIEALRAAIAEQIAQMPHVNDPIVTTWFEVKAELEDMDADYIPYRRYVELCREHNVEKPASQRVLLGFLHDLGVVLHFPDPRLETTNILNPEWVTRGVYRILNTRLPFEEQGILTWEMLARILEDEPYQEKRMFIVDMMRKFELCYELPDRPHTYLIPDLLPKAAPEIGDWAGALRFEFHYPVLPGSILTRLIVRMHRHIASTDNPRGCPARLAWRTGVVLACEGNQALVRADLTSNRITLAIRGPGAGRRDLLTRIREHLGAIHSSIADLRPAAKIPVPGHPEIPPVDYAWLRKLESKGHQDFIPPGLDNSINISQLLAGIEPPARRARDGNTYITNVHGGQVGVIGDKADVDGGINFHQGDE
jgi:internalin A